GRTRPGRAWAPRPVCYATTRALAGRPPLRTARAHGDGFRRRALRARSRRPHVRVPQEQPALQEPEHQERLSGPLAPIARAHVRRLAAQPRPRHQGRADPRRADRPREAEGRLALPQLLSRQPALVDAVRGDRSLRPLLYEGAVCDAEPRAGRAPEPRLLADVLRAVGAPSGD